MVRRPAKTTRTGRWLPVMTVVVFLVAAVGAGFALYTILPKVMDEHAKDYFGRFALILVATFLVVALAARLKRR